MDYTTLDQMIEKDLGPVGTTERDQFEAEAKERIEAWRLGEKVREARKAQNLTQKELGERIGVGEAQISKIESGRAATFTTISRVLKALGAKSASLDLGSLGRVALW
jgi:ribosome-binding protein aMBF1 (putative translation factor)